MSGIRTRSSVKSLVDSNLPSGTGAISAENHRAVEKSIADSAVLLGEAEIRVINLTTSAPPGSPSDRDAYVVAAGATGAWAGQENNVAVWDASVSPGAWVFDPVYDGKSVWNLAEDKEYRWDPSISPTAWSERTVSAVASFSGARAERSSTQSISNGVNTAVQFNTESYDTDSYHDNSTNPSRFTAPSTGKYRVEAGIQTENFGAAHVIQIWLAVNGGAFPGKAMQSTFSSSTSSGGKGLVVATTLDLTAGDYVELYVFQTSGASRNLLGTSATFLCIEKRD